MILDTHKNSNLQSRQATRTVLDTPMHYFDMRATRLLLLYIISILTHPQWYPFVPTLKPSSSCFLNLYKSCASLSLLLTKPTSVLSPSRRREIAASSEICKVLKESSECVALLRASDASAIF